MIHRGILFIAFCAFFLSCEADDFLGIDFSQPEVSYSTPANRQCNVDEDTDIVVGFTKPMDTMMTSNEFSLASPSGRVKGYFTWDESGEIMTFHPSQSLNRGKMYTLSISDAVEDTEGNDLKRAYTALFYVGGDITPPEIAATDPANDEMITDTDHSIVITFSEPIDPDTLYEGITVSPPVQGRFTWDVTQRVITFDPVYPFSWGATYTVTVGGQLKDINGNAFQGTYTFRFTVGDDFTRPFIINNGVTQAALAFNGPDDLNETTGVEKNEDITVTFSKDVSETSLFGAITISSPSDFYIIRHPSIHANAVIKFREPLESETHYTLKVTKGVADLQGNSLTRDYAFRFFTGGVNSTRPKVSAILENGNPLDQKKINPLMMGVGSTTYSNIVVRFDKTMNPHSITVDVRHVMGSGTMMPRIGSPNWDAGFLEYGLDLENVEAGNSYSITIEGGEGKTMDSKGNHLKEDSVWYVGF